MAQFFIGDVPDVLWHGSQDPIEPGTPCVPACECRWWREIPWEDYDAGIEGEERTAYANIVFEHLGLRSPDSGDVPDWAHGISGIEELGQEVGILFVTDDRSVAEDRYGPAKAIDMKSADILDLVPDPNPGTYNAWIAVIRTGSPIPVLQTQTSGPR